jgi:hypothetical protein
MLGVDVTFQESGATDRLPPIYLLHGDNDETIPYQERYLSITYLLNLFINTLVFGCEKSLKTPTLTFTLKYIRDETILMQCLRHVMESSEKESQNI